MYLRIPVSGQSPVRKRLVLHFLLLAQTQSHEDTLRLFDTVVPRWDASYPGWRNGPDVLLAIEAARGDTKRAVELIIEKLDGPITVSYLLYPRNEFLRKLTQEPTVAARLAELNNEAEQAGKDVWDFIVEHDLQL